MFAKGNIKRISLQNFMTYDKVEFKPGPNLNVIVGPNGTGKSTIVNAICLGLAGKASVLGRSTKMIDFIKHGAKKAKIEIDLCEDNGSITTVIRELSTQASQNNWFLNGHQVTIKDIEAKMSDLNIQVDNLCQFLPQDKVASFAQMTPIQMLHNTEKAIDPALFTTHEELTKAREVVHKQEQQVEELNKHVKGLQKQFDEATEDKKKYEKHVQEKKQLELCYKKLPWLEYDEKRLEFKRSEAQCKEAENRLKEAEAELAPLKEEVKRTNKAVNDTDRKLKQSVDVFSEYTQKAKRSERSLEQIGDEIEELYNLLRMKEAEEQSRIKKIQTLQRQAEQHETDLENLTRQDDMQPLLNEITREMRELDGEMSGITQQVDELKHQVRSLHHDETAADAELRHLHNVADQRLKLLQETNNNTYRGVMWLRANQDKIPGIIHEPPALTLNVRNGNDAAILETHIPQRDMLLFIAEDDASYEVFNREMERQNIDVNILILSNEIPVHFKSTQPIESFKRFGLTRYLRDLFHCPDGVMRALCKLHRVHETPVGTATARSKADQIKDSLSCNGFYTMNERYTIIKSRYSDNRALKRSELKQPKFLRETFDAQREEELNNEKKNLSNEIQLRKDQIEQHNERLKACEKKMNQLRNQRLEIRQRDSHKKSLQQKIQLNKDKIQSLQRATKDLSGERERVNEKRRKMDLQRVEQLATMQEHVKNCVRTSQERFQLALDLMKAKEKANDAEDNLRENSSQLYDLETKVAELKTANVALKAAASRLYKEANEKAGSVKTMDAKTKQTLMGSLPTTVAALQDLIHEYENRADCAIYTDAQIVTNYTQLKAQVNQSQTELSTKRLELSRHKERLSDWRNSWYNPLTNLIRRIDEQFQLMFRYMRCVGVVKLSEPDHEEDFEKYGIQLMVKFRAEEQLRALDAAYQSGGERSVATVLYMMAMQKLTTVPFRCIDEVNQGMDPVNERKVFDLVVKTACGNDTAQYFLLTPKLLRDLQYDRRLTVHCIFNSSGLLDPQDWKLSRFLRRQKKVNKSDVSSQSSQNP